jgi:hypothetical protein
MPTAAQQILVPKSQAAALRYILECVENGYHHHTRGRLPAHKAATFAQKMADAYPVLATRGARAYAKEKGRASVRFVIFPALDDPMDLHYYILATDGTGPVHHQERLYDARQPTGRVQCWRRYEDGYAPLYELVGRPVNARSGPTHRWTWVMSDSLYGRVAAWLEKAAGRARSSHEKKPDYLYKAIEAVRNMPGFHGIRQQKRALIRALDVPKELAVAMRLGDLGGYVDKSLPVFDNARTLAAVLDQCQLATGAEPVDTEPVTAA